MKKCINVSYACNDNYILPLCCSIQSLISNIHDRKTVVNVHVLCSDTLTEKGKFYVRQIESERCKIYFVHVDKKIFEKFYLSENLHITRETYYRYLLPDLFKELDLILFLDCDTIILKDISDIFKTNIDNYYIAAVTDYSELEFKKRLSLNKYINAGVILFNLKKLREENLQEKLFSYTIENSESIPLQDQDVINTVLQTGIKILDRKWNTQIAYFSEYTSGINNYLKDECVILHYICKIKPWQFEYKSLYKLHFFKYFYMLPINIQFLLLNFPPK